MRQFTIRWLMVVVAAVAVVLAAIRMGAVLGIGIGAILSCVLLLAYKRTSDTMIQRRAKGLPMSPRQRRRIFLASTAISAVIIVFSDIAFLIGYYGYVQWRAYDSVWPRPWEWFRDRRDIYHREFWLEGVGYGLTLALAVASVLRWMLWPIKTGSKAPETGSRDPQLLDPPPQVLHRPLDGGHVARLVEPAADAGVGGRRRALEEGG
jgi:hypothetical protein